MLRACRAEINSIVGYFAAYPMGFLMGTGGSQVSATTSDVDRIMVICTTDPATGESMGLLDFTVDPAVYAGVNTQSRKTVEDFFTTRVD